MPLGGSQGPGGRHGCLRWSRSLLSPCGSGQQKNEFCCNFHPAIDFSTKSAVERYSLVVADSSAILLLQTIQAKLPPISRSLNLLGAKILVEKRPKFSDINSFEEFNQHYWYREELSQICKSLQIDHRGTKQELNNIIKEYFNGNYIKKADIQKNSNTADILTLDTPLLTCGFSFNARFREYFSVLTGVSPFKFTADMATAWRKVKREKDTKFTIQDLLDIYYGQSDYARYDNSVCQWNQFLKDFCADPISSNYSNKLKVASILWKEVRDSAGEKTYSRKILESNLNKVRDYQK